MIEQVGDIILHLGPNTHDKIPAYKRWAVRSRKRPSTSKSDHVPSPKKIYPWPRKTPRFLKKEPYPWPHANKQSSCPATLFFPFARSSFFTARKKKKFRSFECLRHWLLHRACKWCQKTQQSVATGKIGSKAYKSMLGEKSLTRRSSLFLHREVRTVLTTTSLLSASHFKR